MLGDISAAEGGSSLLTVSQAANRLGRNDSHVRRLIQNRVLPSMPVTEGASDPVRGRGRPPEVLIPAAAVEALRAQRLRDLGVEVATPGGDATGQENCFGDGRASLEREIAQLQTREAELLSRLARAEHNHRTALQQLRAGTRQLSTLQRKVTRFAHELRHGSGIEAVIDLLEAEAEELGAAAELSMGFLDQLDQYALPDRFMSGDP